MCPQMKLSARQVETAKPKDKTYKMADGGGLYLEVSAKGSKYWRMKYRRPSDKKEDRLAFGVWPTVTLAQARAKRDEAKKLLVQGIDPKAEQKEAQDQDQHHVVFEYGDELDIIAPLENIDIPVKQVVGQQMEEQDVGDGHHVASGEGAPADLHSTGKNCQSKGQYDAEAFHCHQCIILNKPLFLTDIRHAFKSLL